MDATAHTHELTPLAATETVAPVNVETKPAEVAVAAVSEKKDEAAPAKTEVTVEMVALSEKKAVDDKLAAKEAEFVAFKAKSDADIAKLIADAAEVAVAAEAAKVAAAAELAKVNGQMAAISSNVAEYQKVLELAIPQELLSDAVLKAASSVVEGYDATKKVAEQSPATIVKLLKFSETVKLASQSTNAGAIETSGKAKKPEPNLVFPGITIKKKKQE